MPDGLTIWSWCDGHNIRLCEIFVGLVIMGIMSLFRGAFEVRGCAVVDLQWLWIVISTDLLICGCETQVCCMFCHHLGLRIPRRHGIASFVPVVILIMLMSPIAPHGPMLSRCLRNLPQVPKYWTSNLRREPM